MVLAVTLVSATVIGWMIVCRAWPGPELGRWERLAFTLLAGTLLWLATAWGLAFIHALNRPATIIRAVVLTLVAATLIPRAAKGLRGRLEGKVGTAAVLGAVALIPPALWIGFVLWRGAIVPPLNHDALFSHMPKAAMFVAAEGYRTFDEFSYLISPRGSNYELLLADAIVADKGDTYTEWPSILFYLGFVVSGVALAERWFGCRWRSLLTLALILAAVPVLLLHAGAHKNDLPVAMFATTAVVATGRWLTQRDVRALVLSIFAFGALAGTKTHGIVIGAAFAALLLIPLLRPPRLKTWAAAGVAAALAVLLLGGYDQLAKLRPSPSAGSPAASIGVPAYGHWDNLFKGPYVLVAAPFARSDRQLHVPWDAEPWFWRRHELFFSHYGVPFAFAALAMPIALVFFIRRKGPAVERLAVTLAALVAFAALLPVAYTPRGIYLMYMPRFLLFIVPVVFAWVAPIFDVITERRAFYGAVALAGAAAIFSVSALDAAVNDDFVPWSYVAWARENPGTRVVPFEPNRVATVLDRRAAPRDRVAFDAGNGAWIYPAYGKDLTRQVIFIPPGEGPPQIPDADWVVIDRKFSAVWHNPNFTALGRGERFLARPAYTAADSRVLHALLADPRYETVLIRRATKEALFRRRR